jgi:hypothetical protein
MSDIDGEDVQEAQEAADKEFDEKRKEIDEQVDSITEKVNEALDRDRDDHTPDDDS